jgi:hypothetical protein
MTASGMPCKAKGEQGSFRAMVTAKKKINLCISVSDAHLRDDFEEHQDDLIAQIWVRSAQVHLL